MLRKMRIFTTTGRDVWRMTGTKKITVIELKNVEDDRIKCVSMDDPEMEGFVEIPVPELNRKAKNKAKNKKDIQKPAAKITNQKSPYPGVYYISQSKTNPWRAIINKSGEKWAASFPTSKEAKVALDAKIEELGLSSVKGKKGTRKGKKGTRYRCVVCGATFHEGIRTCTNCNGDVKAITD